MHGGYDGYEELPNCPSIDKSDDIGNIFSVVLRYFDIVKSIDEAFFSDNQSDCHKFKNGIFGFDPTNKSLTDFIRDTVIIQDNVPYVMISSNSRIIQI